MFKEVPVTEKSIKLRRPICGIGINDADYLVTNTVDGRLERCPYYKKWVDMIKRSYSTKYHERRPTYAGCSVVDKWLVFSNFKEWMEGKDWTGKELDKDIIKPFNKVYGPDTCCFVYRDVNNLLLDVGSRKGRYPRGVYFDKDQMKFRVDVRRAGRKKHVGYFDDLDDACRAYNREKSKSVLMVADAQKDQSVRSGLYMHANLINRGLCL